jgi:hypothetical protein
MYSFHTAVQSLLPHSQAFVLYGGVRRASRPGRFTPRMKIHYTFNCRHVGPHSRFGNLGENYYLFCCESNPVAESLCLKSYPGSVRCSISDVRKLVSYGHKEISKRVCDMCSVLTEAHSGLLYHTGTAGM